MSDFGLPPIREPLRLLQDPEKDPIGAAIDRREQEEDRALMLVFSQAAAKNPELAGEARELGIETNLNSGLVRDNMERIRALVQRRTLARMAAARDSPILLQQMRDPEFAAIAHDQLKQLGGLEGLMRNFEAGQLTIEQGIVAERLMGQPQVNPADERRLREIQSRLEELPSRSSDIFTGLFKTLGMGSMMVRDMLDAAIAGASGGAVIGSAVPGAGTAAGAITGAGAGAMLGLWQNARRAETGNAYLEMIERDVPEDTAAKVAPWVGAINATLEVGGFGALTAPARQVVSRAVRAGVADALRKQTTTKAVLQFTKDWAKGVGAELGTELAQEITNVIGEVAAGADPGDVGARLGEIAGETLRGVFLLGAVAPAVRFHSEMRRVRQTEADAVLFQQLVEAVQAIKVSQRSPSAMAGFVRRGTEGTRAESVYVQGAQVQEVLNQLNLNQQQLQQQFPDIARQLPTALSSGGDVVIPTAEFTVEIARTDFGRALMQHTRLDPDDYSAAELGQVQEGAESLRAAVEPAVERELTFTESARVVEEGFRKQLVETGRVSPREATSAAAVYRAFVETQAQQEGVTPQQFEERFPLRAKPEERPAPVPEQEVVEPETRPEQPDVEEAVEPAAQVQPAAAAPQVTVTARFTPETLTIELLGKSKITSVLHEMAHAFLHIYAQLASSANAPARVVAQMQSFLEWRGIESLDVWNAMSLEQQRPHHEAFAESFEVYAFTGEAPSIELQGVFDRFRRWIMRLWRRIKDSLPELDPTVRDFFDRMLASDEAIEQTQAIRNMQPLFATQEQSGMTDAQWAAYLQSQDDERAAAVAEVQRRSLRTMQGVSRAQSKMLQQMQREHAARREQVEGEIRAQVASEPVYRALDFIRRGVLVTEQGTQVEYAGTHKLHTDSVRAIAPEGTDLRSLALTAPDGIAPDLVAEMFGFDDGRALLEALIERRPIEEVVTERADQRLQSEMGELQDPATIQREIDAALHNPARAKFTSVELNALTRATQPSRLTVQAARLAAQQMLESMPVGQIKTWRFAAAERRANREALRAAGRGDTNAAIVAKRSELLHHEMAREAALIERELEAVERRFARFFGPDEKLGQRRNIDLIGVGRALLAWHGFGRPAAQPLEQVLRIEQYAPEMGEEIREIVRRLTEDALPYREMPLNDFRLLDDGLDALWHRALRERQILVEGKLQQRDAIADIVVPILEARVPPGGRPPGRLLTRKERRWFNFGSWKAWIRHVESWAMEMDGNTTGPVHRYLFALLREPFDAMMLERESMVRPIVQAIERMKLKDVQNIAAPELGHTFADKRELLGALLHAGNPGNLSRLLVGYDWVAEPQERGGAIADGGWWNFVNRMIEDGVLTKADFDFAQSIWDTFETLFPRSQEVHLDIYGYRADEVQAQAIDTPWGKYRGGYFPATVDRLEARVRGRPLADTGDAIIETSREGRRMMPSTGRGFMFDRVENPKPRPLRLDLRLIGQALDDMLRFIHLQRPGRDVLRLLRDERISAAINAVDPHAIEEMFLPWLRDTLRNRVMKSSGNEAMDHTLAGIRRNVGVGIMFANARVGAQQLTGLGTSLLHVPLPFLRSGAAEFFSSTPREAVQKVTSKSDFMHDRLVFYAGQITDDVDVLLGPAWLRPLQEWTSKHGFFLQRIFQVPVDVITWIGAHEHAVSQGRTEAEAVRHADAVVRRSQASGLAPDISRLERSSAQVRLITQFSTFWLATLNNILSRHGADRVQAIGLVLGIVGLGGAAIAKALEGGFEDDDEDGSLWNEVTGWAFAETAQTAFAILPPPTSALLTPITGRFGGRISIGAAFSSAERSLKTFRDVYQLTFDEDRELRSSDVRDAATLLTLLLGLPITAVAKPLQYQIDAAADKEARGAVEQIRGMIMGR